MSDVNSRQDVAVLFNIIAETDDGGPESAVVPRERPRGILSQTDREFLCGLKEYAHTQSEANRRQDIRQRVADGLLDFPLLWLFLEPDERTKLLEEMGEDAVDKSLEAMIAFDYLGLDRDLRRLEERIEHGIFLATNLDPNRDPSGTATDVDASIDIDYLPDIDSLYEKVEKGESDQLQPSEIGALVRAGKLEGEDLSELEAAGGMCQEEDEAAD